MSAGNFILNLTCRNVTSARTNEVLLLIPERHCEADLPYNAFVIGGGVNGTATVDLTG